MKVYGTFLFVLAALPPSGAQEGANATDCTPLLPSNSTNTTSFLLADFIGKPGLVLTEDLDALEASFVEAFTLVADDCWILTSINFVSTPPYSYNEDDASFLQPTLLNRDFSYIIMAEADCAGCTSSTLLLHVDSPTTSSSTLADVELSQVTDDILDENGCQKEFVCQPPPRNRLLAQWRAIFEATPHSEAISSIFNLQPLEYDTEDKTCDPDTFAKFASKVVVSFAPTDEGFDLNGNETDSNSILAQQLAIVANLFQESYLAANDWNQDICDPLYRQVVSVRASLNFDTSRYINLNDPDPNLIFVDFYAAGFCLGCELETNLFSDHDLDWEELNTRRLRRLQEEENVTEDLLFTDGELACLCPLDDANRGISTTALEHRGPNEAEFLKRFRQALSDVTFVGLAEEIFEVDPAICEDEIVDFQQTVVVDYIPADPYQDPTPNDLLMLEMGYVFMYNVLAEQLCDPHYRTMESASILRTETVSGQDEFGNSTVVSWKVEMQLQGRCRGCDAETVSVYEMPTSQTTSIRALEESKVVQSLMGNKELMLSRVTPEEHRSLVLRRLATCYCDTSAASQQRGPREAEVMMLYRSYIESLMLAPIPSVGRCNYGQVFETTFVASVANNATDISEEKVEEMGQSLLSVLRELYTPESNVCSVQFRDFQRVRAQIAAGFNPRDFGYVVSRRKMQNMEVAPSSTPGLGPPPSQLPSSSPTSIDLNTYVMMTVSGICNYCRGVPILTGQEFVAATRQLGMGAPGRQLQEQVEGAPLSNCYCPIESTTTNDSYNKTTIETAFSTALLEGSGSAIDLEHMYEVNTVPCEGETTDFRGQDMVIQIATNKTFTRAQVQVFARLVRRTYKRLSAMYCDPFERSLDRLTFEEATGIDRPSSTCNEYRLRFSIGATCRGCVDGTSMLDETSDYDRLRRLSGMVDETLVTYPFRESSIEIVSAVRRRLQGSNTCYCDQKTVANRVPNRIEFEAALQAAVAASDGPLGQILCNVSVPPQTIASPAPSAAPTEKICNVTLPDEFFASLLVTTMEMPTAERIDLLADLIVETYNEINELHYSPCDFEYRLISNVTVDPNFNRRRLKEDHVRASSVTHVRLRSNHPGRDLAISEDNGMSILYSVQVLCQGCPPDTDLFGQTVISKDEFSAVFRRKASALDTNSTVLENVQEVETQDCPADITEFETVILLELTQKPCLLGFDFSGSDADFAQVEQAVVNTYNSMIQSYCDPFFRNLDGSQIVRFGENTTAGNLPAEIRVRGTCRGCDPNNVDLYAIPSSTVAAAQAATSGRSLRTSGVKAFKAPAAPRRLVDLANCYCDVQAIGDRAPFESEFVAALQQSIRALNLTCIDAVEDCLFGTTFQTAIILSFPRDELLQSGNLTKTLEEQFKATVNNLYKVTEGSCNPEFRTVDSVQAVIGLNTNINETISARRSLQAQTSSPSAAPTVTTSPSLVFDGQPTPPSGIDSNNEVPVIMFVTGLCSGCSNDITTSNQVSARRSERDLQEGFGPFNVSSNCFCPINSTLQVGQVDAATLRNSYQQNLQADNVSLAVNTDIEERRWVYCDEDVNDFETSFIFSFSGFANATAGEINTIASLVQTTYNDLADSYCDPLLIRLETVIASDFYPVRKRRQLQDDCALFIVEFFAIGSCRGCDDGQAILSPDILRRVLESVDVSPSITKDHSTKDPKDSYQDTPSSRTSENRGSRQKRRRRRLEGSDECLCEADAIDTSSPSVRKFTLDYQNVVANSPDLPNICAFIAVEEQQPDICDLSVIGDQFVTSLTLTLAVDESVGYSSLALENAVFDGYNDFVDSEYDSCDQDYTEVFYVEAGDGSRRLEKAPQVFSARNLQSYSFFTVDFVLYGLCRAGCEEDNLENALPLIVEYIERLSFVEFVVGFEEFGYGTLIPTQEFFNDDDFFFDDDAFAAAAFTDDQFMIDDGIDDGVGVDDDGFLGDDGFGDDGGIGDDGAGDDFVGDDGAGDDFVGDDGAGDDFAGDDFVGDDGTGDDFVGDDFAGDDFVGDDGGF